MARRPVLFLLLALLVHTGAFYHSTTTFQRGLHSSLKSTSLCITSASTHRQNAALSKGRGRVSVGASGIECSAGAGSTESKSSTSVSERYPWESFQPVGWSRHLHNYKNDPARFFLAAAEHASAQGAEDAVILDFGPFFRPKMILVHSAEDVAHVLMNKGGDFCKSKLRRSTAGMVLGDGLLLSEGEKHARTRRVMRPSFEGSSLAKFLTIMETACMRMTDKINAAIDQSPTGEAVVNISELIQEATLVIVAQALLSLNGYGDSKMLKHGITNTFRYTSKLQRTPFRSMVKLAGQFGLSSEYKKFKSALDEMDEYVLKIIADRRAALSEERSSSDMLDMFLRTTFDDGGGFSDREIRDELITMLLAGHDTSALLLMWAFNFLLDRPEMVDQVYEESKRSLGMPTELGWKNFTVETVQQLPEIDRFLKEVMRLRPPVYEVTREVAKSHVLPSGLKVRKGQTVIVSAFVQGHKGNFYKNPDSFDPKRWEITEADGRVATYKPPDGHFIPFGFGARTCIGFRFAEWEMAIMLSYICRNFKFTSAMESPPDFYTHVTLNPSQPIKIKVSRRQ